MELLQRDANALFLELNAVQDFPKTQRYNTRSENDVKKSLLTEGCCIGCLRAPFRGTRIGKQTFNFHLHRVKRLLMSYARKYFPAFTFSSVQINKNFNGALHIDSSNAGESAMITVGSGGGGELYVDKTGLMQTMNKIVFFDGNLPHMTLPYTKTRYSIVYFTNSSLKDLSKENRFDLVEQGFNLPKRLPSARRYFKAGYKSKPDRLREARQRMPALLREYDQQKERPLCTHAYTCRARYSTNNVKNRSFHLQKLERMHVNNWRPTLGKGGGLDQS